MHTCLNCDRTEEQIPLLNLNFKGGEQHICPQCLPLLIHKPQVLAEKLPGMEVTPPAEH
ncbi:MAG: hypothetical protein HY869_13910 [Chloroflexi bacterium]|nr:hypothetical protein [Chloroflexota bacterium]